MTAHNPSQPVVTHLVDKRRFALFESTDASVKYRTVIREVDMSTLNGEAKTALDGLIDAFGRQYADFLELFKQRQYRRYCRGNAWRTVRNEFVQEQQARKAQAKTLKKPFEPLFTHKLQDRQWKMALQAASNTIERYWRLIQVEAKDELYQRRLWKETLTPAEKHYINGFLCALSDRFFDLLDGQTPAPSLDVLAQGGVCRQKRLCDLVRQVVHEKSCHAPIHGESRTAWFDQMCWDMKTDDKGVQRLKLMTLTKGQRVDVALKGRGPVRGTLILVKHADGYSVHVLQKIQPQKRAVPRGRKMRVQAADMGYTEAFTTDSGQRFGCHLGELLREYAKYQNDKLRERQRFWAQAKNTKDLTKRQNIRRFNLGHQKWDERRRCYRARIEGHINEALNQMLQSGETDGFIIEAFDSVFRMDGISKKVRNQLSRWVRGLIDERLAFKAAVFGVRIARVPAAYSSQCCPHCHHVHRENRHGDRFRCQHCGFEGQADHVAATNLLARVTDSFFTRWVKKDAIRKHLWDQYEVWCRAQGEACIPASPPRELHSGP